MPQVVPSRVSSKGAVGQDGGASPGGIVRSRARWCKEGQRQDNVNGSAFLTLVLTQISTLRAEATSVCFGVPLAFAPDQAVYGASLGAQERDVNSA